MIYDYFKVSDTDESVFDFNEILKVELKTHNVQSIKTRWDETKIAMKRQPDEEILENLHCRHRALPEHNTAAKVCYFPFFSAWVVCWRHLDRDWCCFPTH